MTKDRFMELIVPLQGRLYRVALSVVHSDADAQDALQEAILKAWEKRHTLRNEMYFATWITRITINESKQLLRKCGRMIPVESVPDTPATSDGITLKMLMECLPEKLRLPFVLCYSEGMDAQEIALTLHLSQSAVRSRIHRAKLILRKELSGHEENALGTY